MSLKSAVRAMLIERDRKSLLDLLEDDRRVVTALNRLIFDQDELVRWRAVEALGWVAEADTYVLESIIGRLVYTMNDDSGSIGWTAPQALGEICANDPDLVEDFFPLVISAMELPVFRQGVAWAIGRVAPVRPDLVKDTGPMLMECLQDRDPAVRGTACWAIGQLGFGAAGRELRRLSHDASIWHFYQDGHLLDLTVGESARSSLAQIAGEKA